MIRVDEYGITNVYAKEPRMYLAGYPSPEQKQRYWQQGGLASLLVSMTLLLAFSVTHLS